MSLLAWPALFLLAAAVVLVALATLARGPKRRDVGTLLIWRRVAAQLLPRRERKRHLEPLLWLLLAAIVLGAAAAARPAWVSSQPAPRVAVYIERLEPTGPEPELEEAVTRAREAAPGAELTFFMAGGEEGMVALNPGSARSELAQFIARTDDYDGRLMLLHGVDGADVWGRVLPRVTLARRDVMFDVSSLRETITFRTLGMTTPQASWAELVTSSSTAGETAWTWRATSNNPRFTLGARDLQLEREAFVVGLGADWTTDAHRALFDALETDSAGQAEPRVWLGGERKPAVLVNRGNAADLTRAALSYDPGHSLFHDLPLDTFDWIAEGRLMEPETGTRPLLSVVRDGRTIGDLVRIRNGDLEFAADPFSTAPIASAALLLDNAIGVVAGVRPSERPGFRVITPLPSRRAALSAPFAPVGELDLSARTEAPVEFSSWLMLAAAAALAGAAWMLLRGTPTGSGPRRP